MCSDLRECAGNEGVAWCRRSLQIKINTNTVKINTKSCGLARML